MAVLVMKSKIYGTYIGCHDLAGTAHDDTECSVQVGRGVDFTDDPGECFKPVLAPGLVWAAFQPGRPSIRG
jgi:hypothetical protein